MNVTVKIFPNDSNRSPAGKLADAELHFHGGPLDGLKLLGFAIWERRSGPGRNVTFPSRTYSVNGEHRSFSLLRPVGDNAAQNPARDTVLQAYADFEAQARADADAQAAAVDAQGVTVGHASRPADAL